MTDPDSRMSSAVPEAGSALAGETASKWTVMGVIAFEVGNGDFKSPFEKGI
jgi:hypothetical protein